MQKVTITLTDEQVEKIREDKSWKCVDDELPEDETKVYAVCTMTGAVYLSTMMFGKKFASNIVFWREMPLPPYEQIMEKRQQKLEL